ncbi:MAG: PrsW family glutamic-type intramembrane protease [Candidatus Vogelbacteria bacterium]|nr:PrsW family glutamic-type intramembrane protease [Candidatus Vogelbacteria bacterium]
MIGSSSITWTFLLYAIIGGLVPTVFWLWFWLQEDKKKPEPSRMIFKTFVVGGFFIIFAFFLEKLVAGNRDVLGSVNNAVANKDNYYLLFIACLPLIAWAGIEEFVKYYAARVAALRNINFDEPVDAMIYLITSALGFAAVENFLFLLNSLVSNGNQSTFIFTGNLRFLGATILHTVTSAILGAFIGFSFYKSKTGKVIYFLIGLLTAIALHTVFNFFIITNNSNNILPVLVMLWVAAVLVILLFEIIKKVVRYKKVFTKTNP